MMGSDYYETLEECAFVPGCLPMGVGDGSVVRHAIVDKNARIGQNVKVISVNWGNARRLPTGVGDGRVHVVRHAIVDKNECIGQDVGWGRARLQC